MCTEQFRKAVGGSFIRLRMTDLNEMTGWIGTFYRSGPDSEFVGARRHVFGIGANIEALNSPSEFQISSTIIVRKLGVVLHVIMIPPVTGI